ncbi:hypothetical protein, partial [Mesorhizobium sp. B264B1A]|uniref:hypothetical protein n=1 Tax=Mesorhizobium sp. B264B1A TaxID=2876668 RepID=UPI001CC95FAE
GGGRAALAFFSGFHLRHHARFSRTDNEKVFHAFCIATFWKTKRERKSIGNGSFLEMKKYSEKIEK